jgi:Icc-related predicted phosphoesterase
MEMTKAFFVSDLHGKESRYKHLFEQILVQKPELLFIGGDLLHLGFASKSIDDFVHAVVFAGFRKLKEQMGADYPQVYIILGNDDPRACESDFVKGEKEGLWMYAHNRKLSWKQYSIYGYSYIPPTPFRLKDWERYDVSRYVDPGCIPPTEGFRTMDTGEDHEYATIKKDLEELTANHDLNNSIFIFHSPPYQTHLDRAALDDVKIDHVPLDVHVGSIAIKRFIEERKPKICLHGHIHESSSITGEWRDQIGDTVLFSAAWDKEDLALVVFELENPEAASRMLIK